MSEETFDQIATAYDASMPAHVIDHYLDKRVRFVVDNCERGRGLDVGCGTGVLAQRLAGAGFRMSGVDPSQGMLDVLADRSPDVTALRGSGTDLPFTDDSFDLVLSVATMHHIADADEIRRTLAEMVRVARPGGRVLIWDHNPRNPYWKRLMAKVPQDDGTERLVPEEEVVGGLTAAGAQVLSSDQLGLVPDFVPASLLPIAAGFERGTERIPVLRRLCAHNVVLARA
ncbi:MAG: class I SAM-dependent methyltransferase [Actinomycetota bacterium]|nr:class I SAM-dependent methyltransferase [Actinomycetota bacterium]